MSIEDGHEGHDDGRLHGLPHRHGYTPQESQEPGELDGRQEAGYGDAAEGALAQAPATGDPGLDEALRELALASAISLEDQLPVIEAVHRTLQDRLADVEG